MADKNSFGDFWSGYGKDVQADMTNSIKAAFKEGLREAFEDGDFGRTMKESLSGSLKQMLQGVISSAVFGSGGGGGASGGVSALLGGNGGGVAGGALEGLLGSEMSFFGGGAGGVVGGLLTVASMTGALNKRYKPAMSGVDSLFGEGPRYIGGDMQSLYGSDVFERAAFSSRNASGDMLRKFADARMSPEVTVHIKPSREFDAISEDKWVRTSVLNSMSGIPRRTNFNHG